MKALAQQIVDIDGVETYGHVVSVGGLMVEVAGPIHAMSVGARLTIETGAAKIPCEVVGFSGGHALAMPFAALDGVRRGCRAVVTTAAGTIRPSERWLGRVVNARAEPIDGQGPLPPGPALYPYRASPPPAHSGVGLATRWISGCVRSTPSSPSAAASGWASSRGPRRCRPCALGRRCLHL
ncbi:MAG: hypothetical protein WA693_22070 [Pseudolabrys sp.]